MIITGKIRRSIFRINACSSPSGQVSVMTAERIVVNSIESPFVGIVSFLSVAMLLDQAPRMTKRESENCKRVRGPATVAVHEARLAY